MSPQRVTVEQYHRMVRLGILTDDSPVELLEGWLVAKPPKNPAHRLTTQLLREQLERVLPPGWHVNTQEPITLDDGEPEPDLSVIRDEPRDYADRHPGPSDVGLVIEVADTTLVRDRGIKKRSYARAGIPAYWIVNLPDRQVEDYRRPDSSAEPASYADEQVCPEQDSVVLSLDGVEVARLPVADMLA